MYWIKAFPVAITDLGARTLQNNFWMFLVTVAALTAQTSPPPPSTVKIGIFAPEFMLPRAKGEKITLAQFRGKKNVVLAFFPAAFTNN